MNLVDCRRAEHLAVLQ